MARILAVDDDPLSRAILTDLLRGMGHTTVVVDNGAAALKELERAPVDMVLSDIVMPGMDGFELAEKLGKLPSPPPVVLLSAGFMGDAEAVARSRGLPVRGYLTKPVDARRLGALVAACTAGPAPPTAPAEWSGLAFLETVNGPLERVSPVRVLFLAHCVDATGALVVTRPEGTARVVIRSSRVMHIEGVPALLRGVDPRLPDAQHLGKDLAAAVAAGHPVERVIEAAAIALGAWLVRLAAERGGTVRFDTTASHPAGTFPLPMPIPRIIANGVRLGRPAMEVQREWAPLGQHAPSVRIPDDAPESRWGLDATAMRVLRLAEGAVHVDHLLRRAAGDDLDRRLEVLRSLDLLCMLGLIRMDGGPVAVESPQTSSERPATSSGTEEDPRLVRLRTSLAAMEGAHPVDILELGDRTKLNEDIVSQAYRDISRRFHPDSFFSAPPSIRSLAEACFQQLNTAFDALRVAGALSEAHRFLADRVAGRGFVTERDHLTSRVAFKRAEALFRVRDWAGADALYQEAVRIDATTWPHAFYAIRAGALSRRLAPNAAVKQLDELQVPDMKKRADVLVAIGNIQKLEGRNAEAMRSYKKAAEADPENRDAQRELRLHQARAEKAAPPASTGVLSDFFRRSLDKKS